jgi:hypothetical protein
MQKSDFMKFKTQALIIAMVFILVSVAIRIEAAPSGASIDYLGNSTRNVTVGDNRTDGKGTINIINLNTVQQDDRWKAYVGNVTGKLTLDDANQYTIYDWTISGIVAGTVFASRNSSVQWASINCSNITHTRVEETYLNHTFTSSDSIENTFMSIDHTSFSIGTRSISSCNFTAMHVNDSAVAASSSAAYQEMTLWDGAGAFVYASRINDNQYGYRNDSSRYDFQMIVPERAIAGSLITYFFFVELQ